MSAPHLRSEALRHIRTFTADSAEQIQVAQALALVYVGDMLRALDDTLRLRAD